MTVKSIAIVAFNNISPFQLSVPCMVFGENRPDIDGPRFNLMICAAENGDLKTNAGFTKATTWKRRRRDGCDGCPGRRSTRV